MSGLVSWLVGGWVGSGDVGAQFKPWWVQRDCVFCSSSRATPGAGTLRGCSTAAATWRAGAAAHTLKQASGRQAAASRLEPCPQQKPALPALVTLHAGSSPVSC